MKHDIQQLEDVKLLVDRFYEKVRQDEWLGPIFHEVIQDRWDEHLPKMYRFWQTVLLREHTYQGSPFLPHAGLPVQEKHFDRWLRLFNETLDEHFEGQNALLARQQATRMARMFHSKIQYYQHHPEEKRL